MAQTSVPKSPFTTILNFRDVGQTVNQLTGSRLLQEGRLFRSARPDDASAAERTALTSTYHIHTILDLRSKSEHIAQSQKSPPGAPLTQLSPITHEFISLNGPAFERSLVWKLPWSGIAHLLYHLSTSNRLAAIHIIASSAMAPRGLTGLALDTLSTSHSEIRAIFALLAAPAAYPLLVHCTQGKDRTGLIVLLVLLLCDVPVDAVAADYMASERELVPEREERLKDIRSIGLGEEFAGCAEGLVEGVREWLERGWGGVEGYLEGVGVGREVRERVRGNVMVRAAEGRGQG